jgi:hypothetical protein
MGWTDAFPIFTEEMVDDYEELATPEDRAQLENWYGTEYVLNAQPERKDIVSMSLFWKNVREGDPELPVATREILQTAQEMGLAKRFNPWDHYVKPLLELVPLLSERFPEAAFRVYLAKDMEFLAAELAEAGNEVHVMKSSSIHFAPGGLWRFLPFSEEGKRVTVIDVDRLNELESDLLRSKTMEEAGLGAWRVPVPVDLSKHRKVSYLPFMGCQFGVQGGLMPTRQLLDAFTWHAIRGNIDPMVILPGCGPLQIQSHKWPSYGFDEFFMMVAAYPRLAQHGMLTFVPSSAKSQLLALDVEYVTWGNPSSELVYFPSGNCCGVDMDVPVMDEPPESTIEIPGPEAMISKESSAEPGLTPKVGFMFLTVGDVNHGKIWEEYFSKANGHMAVWGHTQDTDGLSDDSFLRDRQIRNKVDTGWGSISLVRATLELLMAALEDSDITHFLLVSESCVPVRPFAALSSSLRLDARSRLCLVPWAEMRRRNMLKAQQLENLPGIRKEIAHFQAQWMCLSREDALLVTQQDWTPAFEKVFAPDESYFATVLAASGKAPLQAVANRPITWTDWQEGNPHPKEYLRVPSQVAAEIAESGCFFARKFPSGSDIARWCLHGG